MSTKFVFLESMDILSKIPQHHTILVQTFVIVWIVWFVLKKYSRSERRPSEDEIARKLEEFRPEPLITEPIKDNLALRPRVLTSRMGKKVTVNGRECLNLATHNYLNLVENKEIEDIAIKTINKYGVGSCGPRGFYGTVDVHLELEKKLSDFMDTEKAVVYSYGFSTISSAISAYCKRGDHVYVDEKVNFAIQKGLDASRSSVFYFKHNDVADFERLLIEQEKMLQKNAKKQARKKRFLIIEGIYMNTGEICPLPQLVKLCRKYKLRIFIDESISFGTLGLKGKGITEYYNVPRHEIDLIMASLEWSVGSIGGFCVGSTFIIEHQILSGLGYCFSASAPPPLTAAATASINIMTEQPELFEKLQNVCRKFHSRVLEHADVICTTSFVESPVKHLYLTKKMDHETEDKLLTMISEKCFENNLAVIKPAYLKSEVYTPRPSLRICMCVDLSDEDIDFAVSTLMRCTNQVLAS